MWLAKMDPNGVCVGGEELMLFRSRELDLVGGEFLMSLELLLDLFSILMMSLPLPSILTHVLSIPVFETSNRSPQPLYPYYYP